MQLMTVDFRLVEDGSVCSADHLRDRGFSLLDFMMESGESGGKSRNSSSGKKFGRSVIMSSSAVLPPDMFGMTKLRTRSLWWRISYEYLFNHGEQK